MNRLGREVGLSDNRGLIAANFFIQSTWTKHRLARRLIEDRANPVTPICRSRPLSLFVHKHCGK
jgi:hypothetical protein